MTVERIMKNSIGRLVSILYRKNQVYLDISLRPLGITASELPFIMCLYRRDGISQEELSADLCIDKAATAKAVRSLIEKGYVSRRRNPQDRRANMVFISELALQNQEKITDKLEEWTKYLTFGIDAEELDVMFRVLQQMVGKLEHFDPHRMEGAK